MNSKIEKIITIYWIFLSLMLVSLYQYASGISIRFFGMLACVFCIYLLFAYHLWKQPIVFWMIGFMIWIGISGWANGGITNLILTCVSKDTSLWFILFFAVITMMLVERPYKFTHLIASVAVIGITLYTVIIFINATHTLLDPSFKSNYTWGCFVLGRLTGYRNANVFGQGCSTGILLSIYLILGLKKRDIRGVLEVIFYSIAICINGFALGLSNSRTCIVAVSISVGMLVFLILSKLLIKVKKRIICFLFSTVIAGCICFISIGVLFCPTRVYEYAIEKYNSSHKIVYNDSVVVDERLLQEDDGTLTDRTLIWKTVLHSLEDNPKLLMYGISSGKRAPILNVYPDDPTITTIHAHNSFIEVLRIQGLPALLLLIVLILFWMRRGIQYFFDVDKEMSGRFLMTIAATALIIGIAEPVPFPTSDTSVISLFFFYACGFCSRGKRYF